MTKSEGTPVASEAQIVSPDLRKLPYVIVWLTDMGVSSPRLAKLFDTTPGNMRRLKYFAARQIERQQQPSLITFVPDLELVPSTAMHRGVGIRSHKEIVRRSNLRSPTFDWLRQEIDCVFERYSRSYEFGAGAKSLSRLKQKLGHMSDVRRIALAGLLEQKLAWFQVHTGLVRSAISHASKSLWLLQTAHYRLQGKEEVYQFINSCLIASNANLLASRPHAALQILSLMRAASESISAPLGSEYYRQRGVAYFQLDKRYDDEFRSCFSQAESLMRKLEEPKSEAQVLMAGTRHASLLGKPDWEKSLSVLESAKNSFAPDSLEMSMNRHWAAACGLLIDHRSIRQRALELVESNRDTANHFGHQATISKLLLLTPELGLSRGLEAIWIRKLLYQNAFNFK